jgi:hypothetical protein
MQLEQASNLAVLLRHQFLIHRGDLNEEVFVGEVEIGSEELDRVVVVIELNRK